MIITSQKEWDALPKSFDAFTVIEIRTPRDVWISVSSNPSNSNVEAWESSHVEARGSSHVEARGSSHVEAWGSSHVEAWGSSHVEAWGSSHVEAWGSSHVEAWGSSHVEARGSSHVVAWESSHVEARGSSHVEAWGSSHVEAWESSHVVAWESSHVVARGSVSVHVHSECSAIELFGFAVAILLAKCKLKRHTRTCSTVIPKSSKGTIGWLEREGVGKKDRNVVVLFKRVSINFLTQEGTKRETIWSIGLTVVYAHWDAKSSECGAGKFHACSRPYFCNEFRRDKRDDRYVAIGVDQKDLYAWPNAQYPHKIAFRKGTVLYECDEFGKKI